MKLRTLFRLFLLLAAVAPITTAKADSLIIGTDTLRLDLHWLDDTPLDELARDDRAFEKKFQALIHQPTVEGLVIIRPPSIQAHFLYQAYSTRTERSPYSSSRRGD